MLMTLLSVSLPTMAAATNIQIGNNATYGNIKTGQFIYFGKNKGTDPIKWRVMGVEDGKAILMSEYILEYRKYDDSGHHKWSGSDICKYLNSKAPYTSNGFLTTAFSSVEQAMILDYSNTQESGYDSEYASAYTYTPSDKIVLPSVNEMEDGGTFGFSSDVTRIGTNVRSDLDSQDSVYRWWLRSPGYFGDDAASVDSFGIVYHVSCNVYNALGVRPALKLNLESVLFTSGSGTATTPYVVSGTDKPITMSFSNNKIICIEQSRKYINLDLSEIDAQLTYTIDNSEIAKILANGEIIGLKEGTANITIIAKKQGFKDSEITIPITVKSKLQLDYAKITQSGDKSSFILILEDILKEAETFYFEDSETVNEIVRYVNFLMKKSSRTAVQASKNVVLLKGGTLPDAIENVVTLKKEIHDLLKNQNVKLPRDIAATVRVDAVNLDVNKPIVLVITPDISQQVQDVDYLNINLGIAEITLDTSALKKEFTDKEELRIEIRVNREGNYEMIFIDKAGTPISQIENNIIVALPLKGQNPDYSTVFYNDGKDIEQLGGRYDPNTGMIEFATKNTGEYYILEQRKNYGDIAHLPKEVQEAIIFMTSKGFIHDREENMFDPNAEITRAEFTSFLVRTFYVLDRNLSTSFTDVLKEDWYHDYVASSEKENIIKGYPDQTFRGNEIINREQIVAVCARALHEKKKYLYPENIEEHLPFIDTEEISDWAKQVVALAFRETLIDMPEQRKFEPQKAMTRADAVVIVHRLFQLLYEVSPTTLGEIEYELLEEDAKEAMAIKEEKQGSPSSPLVPIAAAVAGLGFAGVGFWYWKKFYMKKIDKKYIIIFIISLLILIVTGGLVYNRSKNQNIIQEYTSKLINLIDIANDTYMDEEDKKLYIVYKDNYKSALEMKDIDKTMLHYEELNIFLENLPEKYVQQYNNEITQLKTELNNYVLSDKDKSQWDAIIDRHDQSLELEDIESLITIKMDIEKLLIEVTEVNKLNMEDKYATLQTLDINVLDKTNVEKITSEKKQIEELLTKKQYKEATERIDRLSLEVKQTIQNKQVEELKKKEINNALASYKTLSGGLFIRINSLKQSSEGMIANVRVESLVTITEEKYKALKVGQTATLGNKKYTVTSKDEYRINFIDANGEEFSASKRAPEAYMSSKISDDLDNRLYYLYPQFAGGPIFYTVSSNNIEVIIPSNIDVFTYIDPSNELEKMNIDLYQKYYLGEFKYSYGSYAMKLAPGFLYCLFKSNKVSLIEEQIIFAS